MSNDITLANATALLEECLDNGDTDSLTLYVWFMGERELIENTIKELKDEDLHRSKDHSGRTNG